MILIMNYQKTNNNILQLPLRNCKLGVDIFYSFNSNLNYALSMLLPYNNFYYRGGNTSCIQQLNYGGVQNG